MWNTLKCIPLVHSILPWRSISSQHFGRANGLFLMNATLKSTHPYGLYVPSTITGACVFSGAVRERCKDAHHTHTHGLTEQLCSCWFLGRTMPMAQETRVHVPQPLGGHGDRALWETQCTTWKWWDRAQNMAQATEAWVSLHLLHSWLGRSVRWQSNGWFKGKGRSWPRSGGIKRMRGPVGKRHLRSWELGQLPCVCSCLFYLFMSFSMMLFTICM